MGYVSVSKLHPFLYPTDTPETPHHQLGVFFVELMLAGEHQIHHFLDVLGIQILAQLGLELHGHLLQFPKELPNNCTKTLNIPLLKTKYQNAYFSKIPICKTPLREVAVMKFR